MPLPSVKCHFLFIRCLECNRQTPEHNSITIVVAIIEPCVSLPMRDGLLLLLPAHARDPAPAGTTCTAI